MDILNKSIEELEAEYWAASAAYAEATDRYDKAAFNLKEKKRIDALTAQLGNISAADIELIKNNLTLGVETIASEESAIQ
jgi:hypothetical protein